MRIFVEWTTIVAAIPLPAVKMSADLHCNNQHRLSYLPVWEVLRSCKYLSIISLYETFFLRFSIDSALFWNLFSIFATCLMCCYEKPYLHHIYFRITSYDTRGKLCSGHSSYCKEGYGKK